MRQIVEEVFSYGEENHLIKTSLERFGTAKVKKGGGQLLENFITAAPLRDFVNGRGIA